MSLVLDLPAELETKLAAEVARAGLPLSDYVMHLLAEDRAMNPAPKTGADLLAYWQGEGLVGTRPEIADGPAHARAVRGAHAKDTPMIELAEQQLQALEQPNAIPPRIVNPRTKETFVLLPIGEYERLKEEYDDSPWTREELHALAWEAGKHSGWEDMDEYDDLPEKP